SQTWQYLAPEYHARRPIPVTVPADTSFEDNNAFWVIDQKIRHVGATPTTAKRAETKGVDVPSQEITDVGARLADMDRFGIKKQVVFPTIWMACLAEDPDLELALARSYNEFISRQCNQSGGRLWYAAIIPFRRPDRAVEEIKRVATLGGAVGIFARGLEWDKPLSHPSFFPIFEEAERQDLTITVHIGRGSPTLNGMFEGISRLPGEPSHLPPRSSKLVSALTCQYGFYSILESGLMKEFPRLRCVFLEAGSEWMVPAISTLGRGGKGHLRKLFEEGRIFASCEPDEDLMYIASKLGEGCLVAASDIPHGDPSRHEFVEEVFRKRGDLSEGFLEKILCRNPATLYGRLAEP
ncbi:MAG: amidohydrolase family protein, partial [Deltaproteobacteria bacterium]|nr:amidohydrolase family protein [Deltaproteobacteria bacterium]